MRTQLPQHPSKAAPFKIHTVLTDNGLEFTDRRFGARAQSPSGQHEFDHLCQALGIENRLTKPKTLQTNGMVERFNGHLEEVLRSHHFNSADSLKTTLHRYVWLYNEHFPQKALQHITPLEALKRWQKSHPTYSGNQYAIIRDLTLKSLPASPC